MDFKNPIISQCFFESPRTYLFVENTENIKILAKYEILFKHLFIQITDNLKKNNKKKKKKNNCNCKCELELSKFDCIKIIEHANFMIVYLKVLANQLRKYILGYHIIWTSVKTTNMADNKCLTADLTNMKTRSKLVNMLETGNWFPQECLTLQSLHLCNLHMYCRC